MYLSLRLLVFAAVVSAATAAVVHAQATAEAAGIVFQTLSAEDLDMIQQASGRRVGVLVKEVKAESPGAAAGIKANNVIFMIGETPVDSAEKAAAALKAATGQVQLPGMIIAGEDVQLRTFTIDLGGGAGAPDVTAAQPAGAEATATTDPVNAYFDMMDFIRSAAWGRPVKTVAAERARVTTQLAATSLDAQSAGVLAQLPAAWAAVQKQWNAWSAAQRDKQRGEWRNQLLMPGGLYPAPADPQTYTAPQNLVSFQYPAGWTGGMTEAQGTPLLWLGPGGSQAQWEQVLDTPNSPAGALFALAELPAEARNLTYVQGARYLAQLLIPSGLQSLKTVQELPLGDVGAVITLTGKFPGQSEDKFFWIGVAKFGDSQVLAGRLGGPVKEAETLIPAFTYMLQTLQLNPPQAPAGGGVSGAWEAAWSRVDTAIVKNIWAPSGN